VTATADVDLLERLSGKDRKRLIAQADEGLRRVGQQLDRAAAQVRQKTRLSPDDLEAELAGGDPPRGVTR